MGWVHSVENYHGINIFHYPDGEKIPIHCKNESLEGFKYNSSWDWLMPVLNKIKTTCPIITIDELNDDNKFLWDMFRLNLIYTPIETAWEYVVIYIEWYNKQSH